MAKRRVTPEPEFSGAAAGAARERRIHSPAAQTSSEEMAPPPRGSAAEQRPTQVDDSALDAREIERLAYSYWEARGRQGGSPEEDWLRAERELRNRRGSLRAPM